MSEEELECSHCGCVTHTDCVIAEREACAKIAQDMADEQGVDGDGWPDCEIIAERIRARGRKMIQPRD